MKKKNIKLGVILLIYSNFLYSGLFDHFDFGSRGAGIGGSFSSIVDTVDATLWNPSGLSFVDSTEVTFMYGKPYAGFSDVDFSYNYFAFAKKIERLKGSIGIAWTEFNDSDVYKEEIYAVGYGRIINPQRNFAVGLTLKYLGHKFNFNYLTPSEKSLFSTDNKYNLSVDAGIGINLKPHIRAAMVVRNLNEPDVGLLQSDPVPMELRVGLCMTLFSKFKFVANL